MAASQDAIPSGETRQSISPLTVFTLAAGAGLSVASIYYSHPMLPSMGAELRVSVAAIGLVATLTQVGYALGLLFLIPLGDRFDRRRVILAKGVLLALALVLCSLSGSVNTLLLTSLLIGAAATLAQDIVPASAAFGPGSHARQNRGQCDDGAVGGYSGVSRDQRFCWRVSRLACDVWLGRRQHCDDYSVPLAGSATLYA